MFKFTATPAAQQGPAYTVRMLLGEITSQKEKDAIPKLKPYSHFTLACTLEDESEKVNEGMQHLSSSLGEPISFKAKEVINLGTEEQPLWGIKLDLGSKEEELRHMLSDLFDPMMCPERNGNLYLWKAAHGKAAKCPHITVGSRSEDLEIAQKLIAEECGFIFDQVDYKKVGPHDPHISVTLGHQGLGCSA